MRNSWAAYLAGAAIFGGGAATAQEDADLFTKLDANKDGFVTEDEVPEGQKALFERLLRNADKDSDKKLNKEEFQAGLKPADAPKQPLGGQGAPGRPGMDRPNPFELFKRLDANNDGKLAKDELPPGMQEAFASIDVDGDGSATPQELGRWLAANGRGPAGLGGGPPNPREFEEKFDRYDKNGDGKLTKDEIPESDRAAFTRIATEFAQGGDSPLTKEQYVRAMLQARRGGGPLPMGFAGGGMPGGPGIPRPVMAALDANLDGELSKEEIEGAGKALLTLDKNGDGKLSRDELLPAGPPGAPGSLGTPPAAARPGEPARPGAPAAGKGRPGGPGLEAFRQQIKQSDANGDGKISKDEAPARMKENFDRIDRNSDGFLDDDEIQLMFRRMQDGFGKGPKGERPKAPENK